MHRCGAKAKLTGQPCKKPVPEEGKRCRWHGGMSTGPKTVEGKMVTTRNSTTHGIYAAGHTEEEKELLAAMHAKEDQENLDYELDIARILLRRAWLVAGNALGVENPAEGMEVIEHRTSSEVGGQFELRKAELVKRRPDLWYILDRCLGRVGKLIEQKARLLEISLGLKGTTNVQINMGDINAPPAAGTYDEWVEQNRAMETKTGTGLHSVPSEHAEFSDIPAEKTSEEAAIDKTQPTGKGGGIIIGRN